MSDEFFKDVCPACGNGMPHGPAGCARTLQKWQREDPAWCVMMLRDTAERLYSDAEADAACGRLDKYRKGALMQRRLNLLAAANALESLIGSVSPAMDAERASTTRRSAAPK